MTALDDWQDIDDGPRIDRDRFGRPMIIPPVGGKPVPYTRCTTFVGALEDTYNLGRWQQRMVAHGLSARPDLLLRVSSLGPEPPKLIFDERTYTYVSNPRHQPWKTEMDAACDQAQDAAAANAKRTVGSALHAIAERMNREEDVGIVPHEYLPHLAAYAEATDGWRWLAVERFTVLDELKIGGTPDGIAYVPGYDRPMITDLKTGDVTYGQGKIAMQLSVYARSQLYDVDGTRTPLPNGLDLDRGIVIALDATTASCELYEVDLAAAWEAVQHAGWVRSWRTRKGLMTKLRATRTMPGARQQLAQRQTSQDAIPGVTSAAVSAHEQLLLDRVTTAASVAELTQLWRDNRDKWGDELTKAAARRKEDLT